MSDALNYLLAARPEAMTAYFKFVKQAGEHLDPKTRALISVITKVAGQTEKGFRQYLTRALREGATADEILDALLMAFPILGLSKTIWAIEQLQEMDLPEFDIEALGNNVMPSWHDVINFFDIPEGTTRHTCDDRELFVFKDKELINVYDSRCPHQVTNIPELAIDGRELTCPKHGWCFDLNTGECIEKGSLPLNRFEWRKNDGMLQVWW
ncbi:MAG: Rieske 2Fe-2S domain-containing protein [Gammaproteobacteria bacterium]